MSACAVQDGGKQLQEGIDGNRTMLQMDLRLTECGQESEYCINQVLQRNIERLRRTRLSQLEAEATAAVDAGVPTAVRRPKLGSLLLV